MIWKKNHVVPRSAAGDVAWGIDLGGTKIEGAVVQEDGRASWRNRIPTEANRGYDHIVGRIRLLVERMERDNGPRPAAIGIGTPGAVEPSSGLMKNCNTTALNGRPLLRDLEKTLGVEVRIVNDADCFALAEATIGAGKGHETIFGMIIGTGVGGGIVVRGRLLQGPNGIAGEWGHTTLVPDGRPCYCGRRGCVETYISGPAVERSHLDATGEAMRLAEIAGATAADPACERTIRTMCSDFGRAVAQVINVLDPDAIILGGGAGQVPQLKTWGHEYAKRNVFNIELRTPFLSPELGDSAGVIGAALLTR